MASHPIQHPPPPPFPGSAPGPHIVIVDVRVVIDDHDASWAYYILLSSFPVLNRSDGGDAQLIDSARDTSIPKVLSIRIFVCLFVCP